MVARKLEDLTVWQLSHQLQERVWAITARDRVQNDRKFCDQIRDSARSATRNTAEGFGRFYPGEFVRFLRIAAGSLQETISHVTDAHNRRYISDSEREQLKRLALRAFKANVRLTAYLEKPSTRKAMNARKQRPEEPRT